MDERPLESLLRSVNVVLDSVLLLQQLDFLNRGK